MVIFLYNLYICIWINSYLAKMFFVLDRSDVIKRLSYNCNIELGNMFGNICFCLLVLAMYHIYPKFWDRNLTYN